MTRRERREWPAIAARHAFAATLDVLRVVIEDADALDILTSWLDDPDAPDLHAAWVAAGGTDEDYPVQVVQVGGVPDPEPQDAASEVSGVLPQRPDPVTTEERVALLDGMCATYRVRELVGGWLSAAEDTITELRQEVERLGRMLRDRDEHLRIGSAEVVAARERITELEAERDRALAEVDQARSFAARPLTEPEEPATEDVPLAFVKGRTLPGQTGVIQEVRSNELGEWQWWDSARRGWFYRSNELGEWQWWDSARRGWFYLPLNPDGTVTVLAVPPTDEGTER